MPTYLSGARLRAGRGKFADRFTTCLGCGQALWDVRGTGVHPTEECERRAAAKTAQGVLS